MFDKEVFVDELVQVIKDNINFNIAAINAQKDDALVLKTIEPNAYFIQEMNERTANYDPFVFFWFEAGEPISLLGTFIETLICRVLICVEDQGSEELMMRRLFRYQKALSKIFESNYLFPTNSTKVLVRGFGPVQLVAHEAKELTKAIGLELNVTIS